MGSHLHLLVVVLVVLSARNYASVSAQTATQAQIRIQLAELRSYCQDACLCWNWVALQTASNDYTPTIVPSPEQAGPTATSRAFAICHGAIYEAMAAYNPSYKPVYRPRALPSAQNVDVRTATDAAIAEAAYRTLRALYAKQGGILDGIRADYFTQLNRRAANQASVQAGVLVGRVLAEFILANRAVDGSQLPMNYTPIRQPGYHQVDPTHPDQGFLGSQWSLVKPFFLQRAAQFRAPPFVGTNPAARLTYLRSPAYRTEYNEIRAYGFLNSTVRTPDQTESAIFWAYDGARILGTPPRAYNQVVRIVAVQQRNTLPQNCKLFALLNYAMGDAGIAAWETKYFYNFWRPVVGVRNDPVQPVRNWLPLGGAPNDGTMVSTPPFPAYVSGHSTFGSATFHTLRLYYNRDNIAFSWMSDEYNGRTFDSNTRQLRPRRIRRYASFTEAELENRYSRIYLGVHWRSDADRGGAEGRSVAQNVFSAFP